MSVADEDDLLSTTEAGAMLGYSGASIAKWCAEGRFFPNVRRAGPKSPWCVPRSDVTTLIREAQERVEREAPAKLVAHRAWQVASRENALAAKAAEDGA